MHNPSQDPIKLLRDLIISKMMPPVDPQMEAEKQSQSKSVELITKYLFAPRFPSDAFINTLFGLHIDGNPITGIKQHCCIFSVLCSADGMATLYFVHYSSKRVDNKLEIHEVFHQHELYKSKVEE